MNPEQAATIGAALVVIVGGIVTFRRWFLPLYKSAKADVASGRDALLGRDEIRDSITGRVLSPALPGMGIRMDRNEQQMTAVVDAVAQIAPALVQLSESHKRLDDHDERLRRVESAVAVNAAEIGKLHGASVERIVTKAESSAAWRAVEAIANGNSLDAVGDTEDEETA